MSLRGILTVALICRRGVGRGWQTCSAGGAQGRTARQAQMLQNSSPAGALWTTHTWTAVKEKPLPALWAD